jgi:hypothetical protein
MIRIKAYFVFFQKLQELIRRGRPQDLVEANHLMKIMSGYVSIRW